MCWLLFAPIADLRKRMSTLPAANQHICQNSHSLVRESIFKEYTTYHWEDSQEREIVTCGISFVEQVQNRTCSGENFTSGNTTDVTDIGVSLMEDDDSTIWNVSKNVSGSESLDPQVCATDSSEQGNINDPICEWILQVRWEGGEIRHDEIVYLDEGRGGLNKIWSWNAWKPRRVWDQRGVTKLFSLLVSPIENLHFRQKHRRLHMQDKRINLFVHVLVHDIGLIRPLTLAWGNEDL